MPAIKRQYVVDESNRRVAVQVDLETFARIEELLENYALSQYIAEVEDGEALEREQAQAFYHQLDKAS